VVNLGGIIWAAGLLALLLLLAAFSHTEPPKRERDERIKMPRGWR